MDNKTLENIVAISGKAGLFKICTTVNHGALVESLDINKKRFVQRNVDQSSNMLSKLSMYIKDDKEDTMPLYEVFNKLHEQFPQGVPFEPQKEPIKLEAIMQQVVPNYDKVRVYQSIIKKIFQWYNLLLKHLPHIFALVPNHKTAPSTVNSQ